MIIWSALVGAFIGWVLSGFESWGAMLGGVPGALAGLGLRAAVRSEIGRGIERLRLELPMPDAAPAQPPVEVLDTPPPARIIVARPAAMPATPAPPKPEMARFPEYVAAAPDEPAELNPLTMA